MGPNRENICICVCIYFPYIHTYLYTYRNIYIYIYMCVRTGLYLGLVSVPMASWGRDTQEYLTENPGAELGTVWIGAPKTT